MNRMVLLVGVVYLALSSCISHGSSRKKSAIDTSKYVTFVFYIKDYSGILYAGPARIITKDTSRLDDPNADNPKRKWFIDSMYLIGIMDTILNPISHQPVIDSTTKRVKMGLDWKLVLPPKYVSSTTIRIP